MARALRIVIVGAGFGGVAAAIELRRHGFDDVVVLERAEELGGTWHYNAYPGCACDVPSHMYSFSFAQRRDWSRLCSPREEILDYLKQVAYDHGIDALIETGARVSACSWSDADQEWTVNAEDGRAWKADAVILATGQLHQPAVPAVAGRELFAGHSFHSARWDHDYDLSGKRVAVVGTGASAVQLVPEVAEHAARLHVFQRSGNWILPRRNRPYPSPLKGIFKHVPGVQAFRRRFIYFYMETLTALIRHPRTVGRIGRLYSTIFMRRQLRDPELRRKAWPDYTFGCKRILFTSHFLPALQRDNVELVADPVQELTATGVRTGDGRERDVDCIIYATGFRTRDFMFPMEVTGTEGRSLREVWRDGPYAHLGITVPGFPSLFLVYGPNTNTSGGSIIFYEEVQAAYIRQTLEHLAASEAAAIEVRPEVAVSSDRELQRHFHGTAWTDCDSWYRDEGGRIVTNWPDYMRDYQRRVRRLEPAEFALVGRRPAAVPA